jgi:hypothetical protein
MSRKRAVRKGVRACVRRAVCAVNPAKYCLWVRWRLGALGSRFFQKAFVSGFGIFLSLRPG